MLSMSSFLFVYLVCGMLCTGTLWEKMQDEIEMAIGLEEDEIQGALRALMVVVFVLVWPLVLADYLRKH